MLQDGRKGHRQRSREIHDRGRPRDQALDDRAPARIGEGVEDEVELSGLLKQLLKYSVDPDAHRLEVDVSRLRVQIAMSLDGFVAGPEQSEENPLGIGGMQLHEWAFRLKAFREPHGEEGGEVDESTPVVAGMFDNVGATVMGRNMFGGGPGPWGDDPWPGWWGTNPPYHHPVFVLTHHAREPLELEGGTTFHFVTDGIESALQQAREAAGGKDVLVGGGARAVQQYLAAGLVDEMLISIVPLLLGGGARLFDGLGDARPILEQVQAIGAPGVTHLRYRVS